ncbi:putative telomere silencing protein Zds1 [Aspergillus chevalieri]|uniref:Protein Zds1 C-terminal domain-containing protein n=1 Tax=Aspergillus chevalieri TaxID=182096 RepID=A0A7R7ZS98_ASPCH|nr:uncharacterized protein ACHE_80573S [Aspergillus chevalieri]BCR92673.1 hypothetical protein ACHE_80573S [Aspergillus chevalieri]
MQDSSTSAAEAGGGYATRRGHGPHLSISDPSHHVTEAIGHMYDDDEYDKRDSRRLSYISSPLSESITTIPPNLAGSASPTSPQSVQLQSHLNEINNQRQVNGQPRPPPLVTRKSFDRESSPASPGSSKTDTATTSFPLNDVDYESNPAAVAQELNNLAAIRRMSMDAVATSDPDLPDFSPSVAPSPSDDENDASRLFWVPARLHPELAPMEFRSFLESRSERIKRRSTDFASLSPEGPGSASGLRRKRSMLSREIDSSQGYTDGAERLERKRSQSKQDHMSPNLLELESMVDDKKKPNKLSLDGMQGLSIGADEDKPILPPMPQAPGLRRSTRTQYRKAGSVKKGDRPRRFAKTSESDQSLPSIVTSSADQPILGLTRVSTDPTPSATRAQAKSKSPPTTPAQEPVSSSSSTPTTASSQPPPESNAQAQAHATELGKPLQSRQGQPRVDSNGRSSPERKVSGAVETPSANSNRSASQTSQQQRKSSGRGSESSSSFLPRKSSAQSRQHGKDNTSNLNDFANNPQALPGNTTRTDSLSFIPTFSDDRKSESKSESKKSKERKDSEGGSRKSSWHWLLGTEEKDKDKEKKKDKDSDAKRIKSKFVDKVHDSTNSHQSSDDSSNQSRRESFAMDRPDLKLDDDRKKDNTRRSSGESKKEKESSLFSSIFGGGRKKHNSSDSHHKKSLSRNFSPDPPVRELRPDVDYPWTRFPILEERAIYRMAHIKLANPRRALHSQVLLSNFMYSYLAKVQQMHPHMTLVTSAAQRQQQRQEEEYQQQYQRYQEAQQYGDGYEESQAYDYGDETHDQYGSHSSGYQNGDGYGSGYYNHYGHSAFGDDVQLDDDDDNDMW